MIEINNISKKFKDKEVLKNVKFKVDDGEIVGLLGENGAGKSTLLRIISTMLIPTSGNANINGTDLVKCPEDVRKQIGILFGSEVGLYDRLTARENLEYFAKLNFYKFYRNFREKRLYFLQENLLLFCIIFQLDIASKMLCRFLHIEYFSKGRLML